MENSARQRKKGERAREAGPKASAECKTRTGEIKELKSLQTKPPMEQKNNELKTPQTKPPMEQKNKEVKTPQTKLPMEQKNKEVKAPQTKPPMEQQEEHGTDTTGVEKGRREPRIHQDRQAQGNRVWVSTQKRVSFYVSLALRMLCDSEDVELHGLGTAVVAAVAVAEALKHTGLCIITRIATGSVPVARGERAPGIATGSVPVEAPMPSSKGAVSVQRSAYKPELMLRVARAKGISTDDLHDRLFTQSESSRPTTASDAAAHDVTAGVSDITLISTGHAVGAGDADDAGDARDAGDAGDAGDDAGADADAGDGEVSEAIASDVVADVVATANAEIASVAAADAANASVPIGAAGAPAKKGR